MSRRYLSLLLTALVAWAVSPTALAQELIQALPPSTEWDTPSQSEILVDPQLQMAPGQIPVLVEPGAWPNRVEPPNWQLLPDGLLYDLYLASPHEPRFGSQWVSIKEGDPVWDVALGGRVGIIRYGTSNAVWPEGWQFDIEGAGFPRLTLDENRDLISADFRFGTPLTYRRGVWEAKFGYYHLSSHLGDEFMLSHPGIERLNYVRDSLLLGWAIHPNPDVRLYGEAGWAFYADGGAEPWEFRFGFEYSPGQPTGFVGAPFFATNVHLREEVNFGGNVAVQAGWQWRGRSGHLFRAGLHYLNGKSNQYQFHRRFEEQLGFGLWYDF